MPNIEQELQEFVDEVTGRFHPDEPWQSHLHHIAREGVDVLGELLRADQNVEELQAAATSAALAIVAKLNIRPLFKRFVSMAIPGAVPDLVEQLATYSGQAQQFVDEQILPRLREWIATLTDIEQALSNPTPPILP